MAGLARLQQTESYSKNYGTETHKKKLIAQNLF
jgi:hypothetical protein